MAETAAPSPTPQWRRGGPHTMIPTAPHRARARLAQTVAPDAVPASHRRRLPATAAPTPPAPPPPPRPGPPKRAAPAAVPASHRRRLPATAALTAAALAVAGLTVGP